jgi:hypothetical protein
MIILPCEQDVLYGRSKTCFRHIGNQIFRMLITKNVTCYKKAVTKKLKMQIVITIVKAVISRGGRFLTQNNQGRWTNGGENLGKTKVGNALRDAQRGRIRMLTNLSADVKVNSVTHAQSSQEGNDTSSCWLNQIGQLPLRTLVNDESSNEAIHLHHYVSFESFPQEFLGRKWKSQQFFDKRLTMEPTIEWKKGIKEQDWMNEDLDYHIVDEFRRQWK